MLMEVSFIFKTCNRMTNEKTSEGLLVYKKSHGVQVGDVVKVSGQVKEWVLEGYAEKLQTDLPVTEINATDIQITASNQALPNTNYHR